MLDWKPEDLSPGANGGILRHIVKKPITRKTPNDGASVTGNYTKIDSNSKGIFYKSFPKHYLLVHLVGSYEGRVFDERDLSFSIGEIPEDEVISGVQKALTHFGKGEISR